MCVCVCVCVRILVSWFLRAVSVARNLLALVRNRATSGFVVVQPNKPQGLGFPSSGSGFNVRFRAV